MFVPVMSARRREAPPEDWGELRDFIREHSGVHYPDSRLALLVERLQPRLVSLDGCGARDLLMRLRFDETGRERRIAEDLVAPHESGFFREPEALDALVQEVLPDWSTDRPPRVWSAGCASGEEAWTLRYCLGRALGPDREVEVVGTDLSERCVAEARRGEYRGASVRDVPAADRDVLFEDRGEALRVRDEWRRGVTMWAENLLETPADGRPEADVIFCRNVLMYFSEEARRQAAQVLYDGLRDGGILFLGRAESLHGASRAFRPVTFRRGFGYRRD